MRHLTLATATAAPVHIRPLRHTEGSVRHPGASHGPQLSARIAAYRLASPGRRRDIRHFHRHLRLQGSPSLTFPSHSTATANKFGRRVAVLYSFPLAKPFLNPLLSLCCDGIR